MCKLLIAYTRPAQLRKLEGPNYQHKFPAGRKILFHFDVEIRCSIEEFRERQFLTRGRAFAAFFTNEKALPGLMRPAGRLLGKPGLLIQGF